MNFIVYSQISKKKLSTSLGMPEYSYYFVLRGFLPVLEELGQVIVVSDPEKEVDVSYDDCRRRNEDCVFLTFSPPNKSAVGLRCPTVCVLAWEFDSIPNEEWDDDRKNDWRYVFADHGRVITLSQYSADAVNRAMGEDFPVVSIPVPVWDDFDDFRGQMTDGRTLHATEISIDGNVFDSMDYFISENAFELKPCFNGLQLKEWPGGKLKMGFSLTDDFRVYLGGFYKPEDWGTWSRIENPWIMLPYRLNGHVHAKMVLNGYAANANREIYVSVGPETKMIKIEGGHAEADLDFYINAPENIIRFSNLDLTPVYNPLDHRSMGIGLCEMELSVDCNQPESIQTENSKDPLRRVPLNGIVYTSVFNPGDDRKNWIDMVKGFCMAFREVDDAVLILKMTHHSVTPFLGKLHFLFHQMWPFKCRFVVLHGFLDDTEYKKLIAATSFYVNTSRCEGLCLPLMEFMACGKPAVAPCHTSLKDYVDSSTTLIVESGVEPSIWPHDPRNIFRALRYRLNWEDLVNAYRRSYDIVKNHPDVYQDMAKCALLKMKGFASIDTVKEQLKSFLHISG